MLMLKTKRHFQCLAAFSCYLLPPVHNTYIIIEVLLYQTALVHLGGARLYSSDLHTYTMHTQEILAAVNQIGCRLRAKYALRMWSI